MNRLAVVLVTAIIALAAATASAQSAPYVLTGWRTPSGLTIQGINDAGQVIGNACTSDFCTAFVWTPDDGLRMLEPVAFRANRWTTAVNAGGDIVGGNTAHRSNKGRTVVLWSGGQAPTDLGTLHNAITADAADINDRLEIAGTSDLTPFLWSVDQGMRSFPSDLFMGLGAQIVALNNPGHIVAHRLLPPYGCVFWTPDSGSVLMGTLGGIGCVPTAMNDRDEVVGYSQNADASWDGFIWSPTAGMRALIGTERFASVTPRDITNAGLVVGSLVDGSLMKGFVWTSEDGAQLVERPLGRINGFGQVLSGSSIGHLRRYVARVDFNGTGDEDLLWRHADGRLALWFMDHGQIAEGAIVDGYRPVAEWQIAGTGDFNRDGSLDVVWQHRDGRIAVFLMDGSAVDVLVFPALPTVEDPLWRIAGVGDVDGDAQPDLVWQHDGSGALAVWLMDGINLRDGRMLLPRDPGPDWRVIGVADVTGDLSPDLIFRHRSTREIAVWVMYGPMLGDGFLVPASVHAGWELRAFADLNGDDRGDFIWQHEDGTPAVWLMDGPHILDGFLLPKPDTGWRLAGPR
jgi:hypothetical protein